MRFLSESTLMETSFLNYRAEGAFSMRWLHVFGIMGRVLSDDDLSGPVVGTIAKITHRVLGQDL